MITIGNKNVAQKCAEFLLQIKAIKLEPTNPFTWASGLKSPIYCDNRKTLSYPEIRTYIRQELAGIVKQHYSDAEVVAGVATGAIAQGALVAQELGLPFVYVRSEEKKHGLENLIEGVISAGQKVVVIEDLVSTGKSSLKAVEALRNAGCLVQGMTSIFTYELPVATQRFEESKVDLVSVTNYSTLIEFAQQHNLITEEQKSLLKKWREDPENWLK